MENSQKMVTIYVMGKKHSVPADLTIMKAMEYSGFQFKRGSGCRGGFCGACATVYRKKGSYKLQGALACQKIVEDGMILAQIPFSPQEKKIYNLNELKADANTFLEYYPEIARCLA
ncbi:MAG: 2Fe-2S iron-sulfur cluster-binding protein, partial [Candidatus Bathyarchaeota archaeon]|nr:2Fe-2S iron-sulfur cluster-binding protein [Candidatus Bathyarchaeota archaeon]